MPFWTRKKEFFSNMHGPPLQYCLSFGPKHKTFTTDILKVLAIILLKCYCQKKPGNSKRSRSAVYLHVFTVWKLSEKINNHGIWRSSRSIFFEISLFRDFGTSGDLKKHKFWLTLGEVKTYLAKLPIVLIFFP